MAVSAARVEAHLQDQLSALDGTPDLQRKALSSVGGAMAMVESLVLHDLGEDSPFLAEVDRIRKKRLAGFAGLALQVSEARMHYRELLSLLGSIKVMLGD